jgi:glycosyltransferase involved in cell wall biosynthesis
MDKKFNPHLTFIIPIFNEELNLDQCIHQIREAIEVRLPSYTILLIDDGSTDQSWKKIQELSKKYPQVQALKLSRNFGKEHAIAAGLEHMVEHSGALIMDADLQHPPALVPHMVTAWLENKAEIIEAKKIPSQLVTYKFQWPRRGFYFLFEKVIGQNLESDCDFKLLSSLAVEQWKKLPEKNLFFRGMIHWVGFPRYEIPFEVPNRQVGLSKWTPRKLVSLALSSFFAYSSAPIKLIGLLSLLFFMVSLAMASIALYQKIFHIADPGFTTVILLVIISGAFNLMCLFIVGQFVAQIYEEVKGRPRYLILDKIFHANK